MRNILFIILTFLSSVALKAQTITVNDDELKRCLATDYPSLMDLADSSLIVSAANNHNDKVICNGYDIHDLDVLSEFTSAWEINITGANLTDVEALQQMTSLSKIIFMEGSLDALPDLTGLTNLSFVNVEKMGMKEFPILGESIEGLILSDNEISSVSIDKNYPNLEQLILNRVHLNNITGFDNIPAVKKLYLGGNNLTSLPSLAPLTLLEELQLWSNQLTEIEGISSGNNLTELTLSNNEFRDLPELNGAQPSKIGLVANYFTFEDLLPIIDWNDLTTTPEAYNMQWTQGTTNSILMIKMVIQTVR
jgi:Leucine-rich repeat (LRR) protein